MKKRFPLLGGFFGLRTDEIQKLRCEDNSLVLKQVHTATHPAKLETNMPLSKSEKGK